MPTIDRNAPVSQIALDHPASARVFRKYDIDFCCRGSLTVREACAAKAIDPGVVFADLDRVVNGAEARPRVDPRVLPTPQLVAYIVSAHHAYLRRTLPLVEPLARKVARVHKEHNPKLPELADLVAELRETLEPHLDDEEQSLFPLLSDPLGDRRRAAAELSVMLEEHLRVGEMLTQLRTLADDYAVPDWACASYRTLMHELESLEQDTMEHVHIENHVLLPRFQATRHGTRRAAHG